jgi:integrase
MAMGRQRSRSRAGWPDNLYPNRDGFKYRHPITRKETWMGRDQARVFAAAKKLNALLHAGNDLVRRVAGASKTVADAIVVFRTDDIPGRGWKASTAREYDIVLRRIQTDIGGIELDRVTVKDSAEYIRRAEGARGRQTRRLVLSWIFACALQEGWMEFNPAEQTRRFAFERKRQRMTVDAYKAIHAAAPVWLQNAMDLSLLTLLRRDDIASARFSDVHDGALWVVPAKTEESTLVKLSIALSDDATVLIQRCRDDVVSPFLIHRLPEKARPQGMRAKGREHHTQLMPEQITRAFTLARTAAGIVNANAPTFHEIRSLGGALLMQQRGWQLEQVQALMGHASKTMTQVYLEGHDTPWQRVACDLSLPR